MTDDYSDLDQTIDSDLYELRVITDVLRSLGIENTETHREQLAPMLAAFRMFVEKNARYGDDVWQSSGSRGMLCDMRKKLDRMWREYWNSQNGGKPDDMDSVIDLINYAVFFYRSHEAGNRDGSWPWQLTK